jgi:hypothetical protein
MHSFPEASALHAAPEQLFLILADLPIAFDFASK